MKALSLLSLLQLIYSQPVSASNSVSICTFDPFHALRLSPLPFCSLSASVRKNDEPSTEFLSFEEWKARQLAAVASNHSGGGETTGTGQPGGTDVENKEGSKITPSGVDDSEHALSSESRGVNNDSALALPRVPLTDRFNYASQECTARIHAAHKGAKSPSAVLSSKKDRYMLSPCGAKNKYVIVELCDDIRIDTVQLANFEFFSGVFKEIRISLAENSPGDPNGWVDAGTYNAKNNRGVQSFHPPQGRVKFWRYVRIDFLSHYGSEFYCPVSLLRVYGLTHMEDYKWVGWQTGGTNVEPEIEAQEANDQHVSVPPVPEASPPLPSLASATIEVAETAAVDEPPTPVTSQLETQTTLLSHSPQLSEPTTAVKRTYQSLDASPPLFEPPTTVECTSSELVASSTLSVAPTKDPSSGQESQASKSTLNPAAASFIILSPVSASTVTESPSSSHKDAPLRSSTVVAVVPSVAPLPTQLNSGSGESIYRVIMNRLTMLELNSTLSVKYVEEQTRGLGDLVRKLEEDVGRLDGFTKSQQLLLQRAIKEMEKYRGEMEKERIALLQEVKALSEEVVLEKRLGIIQLGLLLIVLVLMAVTRGSSSAPVSGTSRSRSWRSADWSSWRRGSAPQSPVSDELSPGIREEFSPPESPLTPPPTNPQSTQISHSRQPSHPSRIATRQFRQRLISFPPLPASRWKPPQQASTPTPTTRKLAPHLHEVKTERIKRRGLNSIDADGSENLPVSDGEGTPRLSGRSTYRLSQNLHLSVRRSSSSTGRERATRSEHKHSASKSGLSTELNGSVEHGSEGREPSPTTTTAGDGSSEDSAAWEDTTTEGEDDAGQSSPEGQGLDLSSQTKWVETIAVSRPTVQLSPPPPARAARSSPGRSPGNGTINGTTKK